VIACQEKKPYWKIRPQKGWNPLDLLELWAYREVLWMLALRDIKLRYKQTALGVVWVILQPLLPGLIFAVIFGKFARLPSDGQPYLLFVFSGLIPWMLFSNMIQRSGGSLVTEARLITKVYFPRMLVPLASGVSVLVDFFVSMGLMFFLMVLYGVPLQPVLGLLPIFLLTAILLGAGIGLWLSALNVKYRDFMYALPFLVQVWMFATPVVYGMAVVPEKWRFLYSFNPMVGVVEGFRLCFLGKSSVGVEHIALSVGAALAFFILGSLYFRSVERGFADKL